MTSVRTPRRYTRRQKATAVMAAAVTNVQAAAEATGIPPTTIYRWVDQPWAVELRSKTDDDLAEESRIVAMLALEQIAERVRAGNITTRDLIPLYGVAVDKSQLLAGKATHRQENRNEDVTEKLDDHEAEALRKAIETELAKA